MKLTRRLLSILLGICLLVPITSLIVVATGNTAVSVSAEKTMRLYYDEPAELTPTNNRYTEEWDGWHSSLPLGNGYVGATVFGGERINALFQNRGAILGMDCDGSRRRHVGMGVS